jgi:hypothetical protein
MALREPDFGTERALAKARAMPSYDEPGDDLMDLFL